MNQALGRVYQSRAFYVFRSGERRTMFSIEKIQNLNELELSVYEYVIQHKTTVPYMRRRELADEAHVSTTTVLRFCKKMGCDGYNEFKYKLKESVGQKTGEQIPEDTSEIKAFFERIEGTRFQEKLEKAAAMIARADRVIVVGIGNCGYIGEYAARYFTNLGKFSLYISDAFYPINMVDADYTVAIVLSVSGETVQILESIQGFKKSGCSVITITNSEQSMAAKLSDLNISYYITMRRGELMVDYTSQVPAVYLVECLAKKVGNRLTESR